jgi:uncharacterized lipoprotein YmbA
MSIWFVFRIPALMLAVVMPALAGCGASEPAPEVYVLGHGGSIGQSDLSQLNRPVVDVMPVRIPDYLDNKDIVARQPNGQIVASRRARWGERLSVGLTRAVTTSLAARSPGLAVVNTPMEAARWRVAIDIVALEIQSGQCVLAGRWTVWSGSGERKLRDRKFSMSSRVDDGTDAATVATMTMLVDRLAADVSASFVDGTEPSRVASH